MKTARAVTSFALMLALLVGTGGSVLVAQTAAPAAATAPAVTPAAATAAAGAPAAESFSREQLEQLVAPIALYADALLMQILMGATYPLEIVEADRFMRGHADLKDAKLDEALKSEDWDPSVKSLCTLPSVLKQMSENLDWTQDLGDAFLGQKDQLLDTVQIMRGKANDSGNLKTTEQQVVTVKEDKIIVIESPKPEIVYVPTYSPTVVYGGWSYPSYYYPPMYPYYPPGAGLVAFGVGMAVGGAIWGNCNWGWGRHDVNINVNHYNNFNRNTNINHNNLSGNRSSWNHDVSHRKGVNYQNSKVAGQYGAKSGTNRVNQGKAQAQARGYSGDKAGSRQARTPGASTQSLQGKGGGGQGAAARDRQGSGTQGGGDRAAAARTTGDRSGGAKGSGDRAASAKASGGGQRAASPKASSYGGGSSGRSAYGGSSSSSASRATSSRGSSSRGTTSYGGGGSRGGGGMSRGGGGGRRR
jgi:hypothetical protein